MVIKKETALERSQRLQKEADERMEKQNLSSNRQIQTEMDIVRREQMKNIDLDSDRFSAYDVGGKIMSFDESGNFIDTGKTGTAKQGEVIGIESTGRKFNLGEASQVRLPMRKLSREEKLGQMADLRTSASAGGRTIEQDGRLVADERFKPAPMTYTDDQGREIRQDFTGQEQLERLAPVFKNERFATGFTGQRKPVSIEDLGSFDFSQNIGLDQTAPKKGENEDPKDYQIRVQDWKIENLSKTYNAVMKERELDKIREYSQRALQSIETMAEPLGSFDQIKKELRADSDIIRAENKAKQDLDREAESLLNSAVNRFKESIDQRASDTVTNALIETYRENKKKEIENLVKEQKSKIEESSKNLINETAQGVISQSQMFQQMAQLSPDEIQKIEEQQEKQSIIDSFRERVNPKTGQLYTALQAKAEADKVIKSYGQDVGAVEKYENFTDAVASDPTIINDSLNLFETAQLYTDTNEEAHKLISTFATKKVADEAQSAWLLEQGFDPQVILGAEKEGKKQEQFLSGKLKGAELLSYMDNLEVDNPEKAKRAYQRALINGSYDDDPIIQQLLRKSINDSDDVINGYESGTSENLYSLIQEYDISTPTRQSEIIQNLRASGQFDKFSKARSAIMRSDFHYTQLGLEGVSATLRNSNMEREIYTNGLLGYKEFGLSPFEARNLMLGYRIQNPEDKQFAEYARLAYMSSTKSDTAGLSTLAQFINQGDYAQAMRFIEQENVPENAEFSYIKAYPILSTTNRAKELIKDVGDKFMGSLDSRMFNFQNGTITSSFERMLDKVGIVDSEERAKAVELGSLLAGIMAEKRNEFAGTAVTETELKALRPLLVSMRDQPSIAISKIQSLENEVLRKYNATRKLNGLESLIAPQELIDDELYINANMAGASKIKMDSFVDPFQKQFDEIVNFFGVQRPSSVMEFRESQTGQMPQGLGSITKKHEGSPRSISEDMDMEGNTFPSYGSFQMNRDVARGFAQEIGFNNTDPNSEEFRQEWITRSSSPEFEEQERQYIIDTQFTPYVEKLRSNGIPDNILNNTKIQELLFDLVVNSGLNNTIFETALRGKSPKTIQEIIDLVTQERVRRAKGHPRETGMNTRYFSVKRDLTQ